MIQLYNPRRGFYVFEVRQAFKKTNLHPRGDVASSLHDHRSSPLSHLENFRVLVNDVSHLSTQDGLEEAVHSAYGICYPYDEQDFESISGSILNATL